MQTLVSAFAVSIVVLLNFSIVETSIKHDSAPKENTYSISGQSSSSWGSGGSLSARGARGSSTSWVSWGTRVSGNTTRSTGALPALASFVSLQIMNIIVKLHFLGWKFRCNEKDVLRSPATWARSDVRTFRNMHFYIVKLVPLPIILFFQINLWDV